MPSSINKLTECTDDVPSKDMASLIKQLSHPDSLMRVEAREMLSCIGAPASSELLKMYPSANTQVRWQIIKIFDAIHDPATISTLIQVLMDENAELRWAASNALINFRREAMPALLEALTRDFDSLWLRQSAHHILRVLRDNGKLTPAEEKVFQALEGVQASVSVPWASQKALAELKKK